jgi:hyperosmotically inducible periplasmic protein
MKVTHRGFFIVIIMAFFFGFAGCQQDGTAEKAGKKIDQATEKAGKNIDQATEKAGKKIEEAGEAINAKVEKTGEFMDDAAITAKIKAEILSDPLLKVSQIDVTTTNSVVMLSGVVDSKQSIDRAVEIVHSIKNVKSVENNLVVK